MVWSIFQSGEIRKLREQLDQANRELTAVTSLCNDLAKRALELERRVKTLSELERRVQALEGRVSGVERAVALLDHASSDGAEGEEPPAGA